MKTVSVVGLGYIGLPLAALAADAGYIVRGVDILQDVLDAVNNGKCNIEEEGLEEIVFKNVKSGRLSASSALESSDIYIIAVPTPVKKSGGLFECDTSMVEKAATDIANVLENNQLVIIESTCSIGTTEAIKKKLGLMRPDLRSADGQDSFYIAYCPERIIPGNMISELRENDRVIGGYDLQSTQLAKAFYDKFVKGNLVEASCREAEAVKLVENSSRDVQIAFANEISMLLNGVDIDYKRVIDIANRHPRVNILSPGIGVGGHCIPVDPWFLIELNPDRASLLRAARSVNLQKTRWSLNKVNEVAAQAECIVFLGAAFKKDTEDLRNSPAVEIIEALSSAHYEVFFVEPNNKIEMIGSAEGISLKQAVKLKEEMGALLIRLVDHSAFESIGSLIDIDLA